MKKILLSLSIMLVSFAGKAQVDNFNFINSADPTGTAITFLVYGDNTTPTSCAVPYITSSYATPYMMSVPVFANTAAWTVMPTPSPATTITYVRIFYNGPLGLESYDYSLCGLSANVFTDNFVGGAKTSFTAYVGGNTSINQGSIQITIP